MRVIIESPFKGDIKYNTKYAQKCLKDSLDRGEAPLVFHLLYTQVLDEDNDKGRSKGLTTSFEWHKFAELIAVYQDFGISYGMQLAINLAKVNDIPVEYRRIM
jgi:hypothetical protein